MRIYLYGPRYGMKRDRKARNWEAIIKRQSGSEHVVFNHDDDLAPGGWRDEELNVQSADIVLIYWTPFLWNDAAQEIAGYAVKHSKVLGFIDGREGPPTPKMPAEAILCDSPTWLLEQAVIRANGNKKEQDEQS